MARVTKKNKEKKNIGSGRVYVMSSFNNSIITATDNMGNTLCQSSAGANGFKGSKKGTPFAAQLASESVAKKCLDMGMKSIDVYVKGLGSGRDTAIRSLQVAGLTIGNIRDITPIPHNGCRPPKKRRV